MSAEIEQFGEHVRIYKRGGVWWANLQHRKRQIRRSLRTKNIKVARRKAVALEQSFQLGAPAAPKPVEPADIQDTVDRLMQHLEAESRAPRTLRRYRGVFREFVEFAQAQHVTDITGVTPEVVDRYRLLRRQAGRQPKTVYTETVLIRQLVNFAVARGLIAFDPLRGLRVREPKPTPQPCWTPEQVEQILAAAPEHHRPILTLLADTGLRVGEAQWLTWNDVEANIIHVRPKSGWTTKTGNIRVVPLTPRLQQLLAALPHRAPWVFTAPPSARYPNGDHRVSERRLLVALKRVLKRLELPGHLHTFRHAFISRAVTSGVPEAIVRQWVGHVDPNILRLYTHVADVHSRAAMQQLTRPHPSLGRRPSMTPHDQDAIQYKSSAVRGSLISNVP